MCVCGNIVFLLAGFDAAQTPNAFGGIYAECPTVLGPVISRDCRVRRYWRCCGLFAGEGLQRPRIRRYGCGAACQGPYEPTQEFASLSLLFLEFFFIFHLVLLQQAPVIRMRYLQSVLA